MNRYSTFWRRFWAEWIDVLIFLPWFLAHHFVLKHPPKAAVLICWVTLYFLVLRGYKVVLHARFGQTAGKAVTRIRVMNIAEDRLPSIKQAFLREIGSIILSACTLGYWIYLITTHNFTAKARLASIFLSILFKLDFGWIVMEFVTMMTNKRRRAIHDFIASTVVVRTTIELATVVGLSSSAPLDSQTAI